MRQPRFDHGVPKIGNACGIDYGLNPRAAACRFVENNVRKLREQAGWSMATLAEKLASSISSVNRLERGERELSVAELARLAAVFTVHPREIAPGLYAAEQVVMRPGLTEDAVPFVGDGPLSDLQTGPTQDKWRVRSAALDAIGIEPGDAIIVDKSQTAIDAIATGDAVVLDVYEQGAVEPTTLLRQFLEPDLFTTNSKGANPAPLNRRVDNVAVRGVIIGRVQALGRHS